MRLLGPIIRLQVQRSSLKLGELGKRWYDPASIKAVDEVRLSGAGVVAPGAGNVPIVDVHHREHPMSKQGANGANAVSIGFSAHYDAMRERLGEHLTNGIAGENILVRTDAAVSLDDLRGGLIIRAGGGPEVRLEALIVAEPCVEFTRFTLHRGPDARADTIFTSTFDFLRAGTRGFYATYPGEPATIRVGDQVFLPG